MENKAVVLDGGIAIAKKRFQWKIHNFATILNYESLLEQQEKEFEMTCNGVTSTWRVGLTFRKITNKIKFSAQGGCFGVSYALTETTGRRVRVYIKLMKITGGPSSLSGQVRLAIEGKDEKSPPAFRGFASLGPNCSVGKRFIWTINSIIKDTPLIWLPLRNAALIINADMYIFSEWKQKPASSIGTGTETVSKTKSLTAVAAAESESGKTSLYPPIPLPHSGNELGNGEIQFVVIE